MADGPRGVHAGPDLTNRRFSELIRMVFGSWSRRQTLRVSPLNPTPPAASAARSADWPSPHPASCSSAFGTRGLAWPRRLDCCARSCPVSPLICAFSRASFCAASADRRTRSCCETGRCDRGWRSASCRAPALLGDDLVAELRHLARKPSTYCSTNCWHSRCRFCSISRTCSSRARRSSSSSLDVLDGRQLRRAGHLEGVPRQAEPMPAANGSG
jgi:hypothetical protein